MQDEDHVTVLPAGTECITRPASDTEMRSRRRANAPNNAPASVGAQSHDLASDDPSFIKPLAVAVAACGYGGQRAALSKRSAISTAVSRTGRDAAAQNRDRRRLASARPNPISCPLLASIPP